MGKRIGYVDQGDYLYAGMTARAHLEMVARIRGLECTTDERNKLVEYISRMLELSEDLDHEISTLSAGIRRRLSIASALMGMPDAVVMDEPTSAVAPQSRTSILECILYFRATFNCSV